MNLVFLYFCGLINITLALISSNPAFLLLFSFQIFVKNPVTGERADFSQFMETLKTAASLNGCSAIMSDDEEIWQATVKGDSAGALMEIKTMLGLITALGLKGPESSTVADVHAHIESCYLS